MNPAGAKIEDLPRDAAPRVLAAVVRRFGDFADAEDAVQEAMIDAARQWPAQGTPENPTGWLVHVASRRMTDRIRSDTARRDREAAVVAEDPRRVRTYALYAPQKANSAVGGGAEGVDDTLVLMLMCCHPALTAASQVALTLRAVAGLTAAEIGRAFLVPEAAMAQRTSGIEITRPVEALV